MFRRFALYTVICLVIRFHTLTKGRRMLGAFVCGVCLGFGACCRPTSLNFFSFFCDLVRFDNVSLFRFLRGFHFLFGFVVELRAASDGIGFRLILHLLMGGFDEVRGEGSNLILA